MVVLSWKLYQPHSINQIPRMTQPKIKVKVLFFVITYVHSIGAVGQLLELTNEEQVEQFIESNFDYLSFELGDAPYHPYDSLFDVFTDSIGVEYWKNCDLNHDGRKDLFVLGHAKTKERKRTFRQMLVVLGGKKKPTKIPIGDDFFNGWISSYPKIVDMDGKDFLILSYQKNSDMLPFNSERNWYTDTLYFINEKVMMHSVQPLRQISKIEFSTDYCYGFCPVFEITVFKNRDVYYNGIDHVINKGDFKLRINNNDYGYLIGYLNNMRINSLNSSYEVGWSDSQTAFLTVTFENGDEIEIADYGRMGSFGLSVLYDFFFELKDF